MEIVFALLFLLVLLFIAMLPVIILFGLFGMAFKSLGAIILFALKYLLPFGIIGLIIAKIRAKKEYFLWEDYWGYIGGAIGVGLVLLVVWLNLPVNPALPESQEVKKVAVSYEVGGEKREASTETDWLIDNMVSSLHSAEYKRTLREFVKAEEDDYEYRVAMIDADGKEWAVTFCNHKVLSIQKGGINFYYKMKGEATVPQDWAENIFTMEKEAESEKMWKPFVDELFSSINYNKKDRSITFVIPKTIPEGNYDLDIYIEGSREYSGGDFEPREFFIYEDEQKKDLWKAGEEYSLPAEDIIFSRFSIKVKVPYIVDPYVFDAVPLLPEGCVYKK